MDYFDKLRSQAADVAQHVGSTLEIVPTNSGGELLFCHIPLMVPLTIKTKLEENSPLLTSGGRESIIAYFLALHHLNTGNGVVIPEIAGLDKTCPIRFTGEIIDTMYSESFTIRQVFEVLARDPLTSGPSTPCAFIGAMRSAVSIPTSITTGILGYPQISAQSTSPTLNDKEQYKLFGRTIPADDGTSIPVIAFFEKIKVNHFGIMFWSDPYGIAFAQAVQFSVQQLAPHMRTESVEIPASLIPSEEDIRFAVEQLKKTEFRYFFVIIIGKQTFEMVMLEAYRQGIAGPGYTWIFSDGVEPGAFIFEEGSDLIQATKGASVLKAEGGIAGLPIFDSFYKSWKETDQESAEFIDTKLPTYENNPSFKFSKTTDIIQKSAPGTPAAFHYDAAIALGLAACNGLNNGKLDGVTHFEAFKNSTFEGISGQITIDKVTGSRTAKSALFQLTNMLPSNEIIDGKMRFNPIMSELYQEGKWITVTPYTYSDGATNPHPDLPLFETDYLYIYLSLRIIVLLLSSIAIILSIVCAIWTWSRRRGKVVRASQPEFLFIICSGTLMMGASMIPLSLDDEIISSGGDVVCMAFPWLFCVGFSFSFSALFSKTWRLNKLFYNPAMCRKKVTAKEVIYPLLILVTSNIIILVIWTILSPLKWTRIVTKTDKFGRPIESRGKCLGEDPQSSVPYAVCLGIINVSALLIALYQLYRSRYITMEFGETKYMAAAISGMILVTTFSVPIMFIATENPRATVFVWCSITFVICVLFLLFIFIPKVKFDRKILKGDKSMRSVVSKFSRQSAIVKTRETISYNSASHRKTRSFDSNSKSKPRRLSLGNYDSSELDLESEVNHDTNFDDHTKSTSQKFQLKI